MYPETYDDIKIRQNATQIRLLESIKGLLVGILLVLLVPIVFGTIVILIN
jgi:hypothetical protein